MGLEKKSFEEFSAMLKNFAKASRTTMRNASIQQMRLAARDAMIFSPPMAKSGGGGLKASALKIGETKTARDIRRILVPADDAESIDARAGQINLLVKSVRDGDNFTVDMLFDGESKKTFLKMSSVMRKIASDTDPVRRFKKAKNFLNKTQVRALGSSVFAKDMATNLRSVHDNAMRPYGGRFKPRMKYRGMKYMVKDQATLDEYIKTRQAHVGITKAGWAECLAMAPRRKTKSGDINDGAIGDSAGWVVRHKPGNGVVIFNESQSAFNISMANMVANINGVANDCGMPQIVYGNRVKQMQSIVDRMLKKEAEENGIKLS
jgi:hypothetical protein